MGVEEVVARLAPRLVRRDRRRPLAGRPHGHQLGVRRRLVVRPRGQPPEVRHHGRHRPARLDHHRAGPAAGPALAGE